MQPACVHLRSGQLEAVYSDDQPRVSHVSDLALSQSIRTRFTELELNQLP